jgi:hypothetical protein
MSHTPASGHVLGSETESAKELKAWIDENWTEVTEQ